MVQKTKSISSQLRTGVMITAVAAMVGCGAEANAQQYRHSNGNRERVVQRQVQQMSRREGGFVQVGGNYSSGLGLGSYRYCQQLYVSPYYGGSYNSYGLGRAIYLQQPQQVIVVQAVPQVIQVPAAAPQIVYQQQTTAAQQSQTDQSDASTSVQGQGTVQSNLRPMPAWSVTEQNFNPDRPIYWPKHNIPITKAEKFESYQDFLAMNEQVAGSGNSGGGSGVGMETPGPGSYRNKPDMSAYYEVPKWFVGRTVVGGLVAFGLYYWGKQNGKKVRPPAPAPAAAGTTAAPGPAPAAAGTTATPPAAETKAQPAPQTAEAPSGPAPGATA